MRASPVLISLTGTVVSNWVIAPLIIPLMSDHRKEEGWFLYIVFLLLSVDLMYLYMPMPV
jgi:hypothetical protein